MQALRVVERVCVPSRKGDNGGLLVEFLEYGGAEELGLGLQPGLRGETGKHWAVATAGNH